MKKVLIITYYWPPMGGGGVQRWLKFSKYLPEFGWEPVIYTPENADVSNEDASLLSEVRKDQVVWKHPIWEPFDLYKKFIGKSKDEKIQPGFLQESDSKAGLQKLSVWVRGNLFIPDAKRYWINTSVRHLTKMLKKKKVEAIISTGPPHSNHLIAMRLKERLGIKWIADFRDPWTNIDYYDKLMLTSWADRKHRKLERKVLENADKVVTVSWSWARDFEKSCGILPQVITNGYDPEDFNKLTSQSNSESLVFTHIGSLNQDRNPHSFWKALGELKSENSDLNIKVKLIGPTDITVFDEIEKNNLKSILEHVQHMPHGKVLQELVNSDVLLLPLNDTPNIDGVIPGKLYEYLASKRPILCIGKPTGDSARIIKEAGAGKTFDFDDGSGIRTQIKTLYEQKTSGSLNLNQNAPDKFSRKTLAGDYAKLLDDITTR